MVKKCPIVQKKTVCAQKMETYERFKVFEQYESDQSSMLKNSFVFHMISSDNLSSTSAE